MAYYCKGFLWIICAWCLVHLKDLKGLGLNFEDIGEMTFFKDIS